MERMRVLIVDDDPEIRTTISRALRMYCARWADVDEEVRFDLDEAESAEDAAAMIDAAPPEIVLLDNKLFGMSGMELLEDLAESRAPVLTIMITAYASIQAAITAIRHGAFEFLIKPISQREIQTVVAKAARHLLVERRAARLERERRQVRFQFTSILAHELKAPLGVIEGNLKILRDQVAGADPETYLHLVERSLVRLEGMRAMILDLLDLTRIESGQRKRELTDVDLRAVAEGAMETARDEAGRRGIAVALRAAPEVRLVADRRELEMIVTNLVTNAVKYNRDGGTVEVELATDAKGTTIRVADTGIGMTREEAARLFQDFSRIRNEKTDRILGTGLGLSIVRRIALLYGGDVTVESEPDVGTTFTVTLPRAKPDA